MKCKRIVVLLLFLLLIASACENEVKTPIDRTDSDNTNVILDKKEASIQSEETVIAYMPKSLDNPVFLETKEEAERESQRLGVKFDWLGPMIVNSEEQEKIFESLIERKVDGIVISVIDTEKMTPLINKAVSQGIKVATFDSDAPSSDRAFYVGTDNYKLGKAVGQALLKIVKEKNMENQSLDLMIMTGMKESGNLETRIQGFREAIEELEVNIVEVIESNDDINIASELLENYLKENPDFDLFFSAGGWPFFAPADGMLAYKNWRENGGIAVSVDTFYPIVSAANQGLADALVGQDFKEMGRLSMDYMYKLINGVEVKEQMNYTNLEYGTPDNYEEMLKNKKPWEIK